MRYGERTRTGESLSFFGKRTATVSLEILPADTGNGLGFSAAQGADSTNATGVTSNAQTNYKSSFIVSAGGNGDPLAYACTGSSANFAFHTGHDASKWNFYFAVNVSSAAKGRILNNIQWLKHSNACGNVDFFGTMRQITNLNYSDESQYTHLGRIHMGGSGSAADCNASGGNFNSNSYGYQWYMFKVVDNNSSAIAYPGVGTQNGWAMYGFRLNKV